MRDIPTSTSGLWKDWVGRMTGESSFGFTRSPEIQGMVLQEGDDDADSLSALAKLLKHAGFDVHAVQTCKDALAVIAEVPIDLVITDLGLPNGHGAKLMCNVFGRITVFRELPCRAVTKKSARTVVSFLTFSSR